MIEQKKLIKELRQFLQRGKRKQITLEDYFRLTDPMNHWKKETKVLLTKAVCESKALTLFYKAETKLITTKEDKEELITISKPYVKVIN